MIYSSNSPHSQPSPPRTFFCYWDWCRVTFSTADDLAYHVRYDHIRKLQPMSKKEIVLMRKRDVEEAQSLMGSSVLVCHHEGRSQMADADSADQGSSASHSADLSQTTSPFPPERTSSSPAVHGVNVHQAPTLLQTNSARREFQILSRLSSPPDISSIASLQRPQDLSTYSLRPNLEAQIDQGHSRLTEEDRSQSLRDSSCSQSSNSSQDAVERQLTQDDVVVQKPEAIQSGAAEGAALFTSELEDPANIISSVIKDADADLRWPESEPELSPVNQSRQLSPPVQEEETGGLEYQSPLLRDRGRLFHSGTLHISPLPQRTKLKPAIQPQETSSLGDSQGSAHSYQIVLQTQAPYQSQSYELSSDSVIDR